MLKSLSIVMPCFNEQDAIPEIIPRALAELRKLISSQDIAHFELIVVDDKSTDKSEEILKKYPEVKVIKTPGETRGYGLALKTGFREARGEWIGFLDVDNSYRPEDFSLFINEIKKGQSDFIMGQRGAAEKGMSLTRGFGNWFYMFLAQIFYGSHLSDVCSGFRFFHRRHLGKILSIRHEGLDFSIELTLQMIGSKISLKALPIEYDERIGQSKLSVIGDGLAFLKVILFSKMRQVSALKHSRV